jgi:hypothetical protein
VAKFECDYPFKLFSSFRQTDISFFQRRRIVNTVSGDGHNGSKTLETFYDDEFLLRRCPGEDDFRIMSDKWCNSFIFLDKVHKNQ